MTSPSYVLVTGPPASGKSAIAPVIAQELHLPLIAKDTIKEALMSVLPVPDVPASQQIGRAAIEAMFALAAASGRGAVLDANLHRSVAVHTVRRLSGQVVEVFCRVDPAVAGARCRARAGSRHPGHLDEVRLLEDVEHRDDGEPVAGGWPVLEVATDRPVDIAAIVAFVRATC